MGWNSKAARPFTVYEVSYEDSHGRVWMPGSHLTLHKARQAAHRVRVGQGNASVWSVRREIVTAKGAK